MKIDKLEKWKGQTPCAMKIEAITGGVEGKSKSEDLKGVLAGSITALRAWYTIPGSMYGNIPLATVVEAGFLDNEELA